MILNTKQILKQGNYYIVYNFNKEEGYATVNVSWLNEGMYQIKYNPAIKGVATNWNNTFVPCTKAASTSIAYLLLMRMCGSLKFPKYWLQYQLDNNVKDDFVFDIYQNKEELSNAAYVYNLTSDLIKNGLQPEHIDMAKEWGIWDDFQSVVNFYLSIKIDSLK